MNNKKLRVEDMGELALIHHLSDVLGPAVQGTAQDGVICGIGDDAAVLQGSPGSRLLAASDMLVEGVHFDLDYFTPLQLGWKALAVNLSDIAAMGGRPRWALVSLGLKPGLEVPFVEEIYAGMAGLAREYGVAIVGGDTCLSPERLVIDVCILGEVSRTGAAYRSGARENDIILVTGKLGASAAGLAYLQQEQPIQLDSPAELLRAHLTPTPRVREAGMLVRSGLLGAMNDISDGLASELHEIVEASGCGARIWAERIPLSKGAVELAGKLGVDPLEWALFGGEDYELLLTVSGGKGAPLKVRRLARQLEKATGTSLSMIGKIFSHAAGVEIVSPAGEVKPLSSTGYDHFKK